MECQSSEGVRSGGGGVSSETGVSCISFCSYPDLLITPSELQLNECLFWKAQENKIGLHLHVLVFIERIKQAKTAHSKQQCILCYLFPCLFDMFLLLPIK
jgi:hypothetical protein